MLCREVRVGACARTCRSLMSEPRKMMYSYTSAEPSILFSTGRPSVPKDLTARKRSADQEHRQEHGGSGSGAAAGGRRRRRERTILERHRRVLGVDRVERPLVPDLALAARSPAMLSAGGSPREREQLSAQSAPLACAGWELVAKNAWADLIKEILDPL